MLEKALKAKLILEDGTTMRGRAFGHLRECVGEVIFTTGSAGYQEAITDPAYGGKIVVWTYPLVGNYGFNLDDNESGKPRLKGLVVREKCDFPNNWRCEMDIDGYFRQNRLIGLEGVDTRALTRHIRQFGVMKGIIDVRGDLSPSQIKQKFEALNDRNIVRETSANETYTLDGSISGKNGKYIGVLDLGVTNSALKELKQRFAKITVFPAFTSFDEIKNSGVQGLYVSGGPGSPSWLEEITGTIKQIILLDKIPILGVSLGALLVATASGCEVGRMAYGHHGVACPVKDLQTGKLYTTVQKHLYGIETLADGILQTFVNINDRSVEGFINEKMSIQGVLFDPQTEQSPSSTGFVYDCFAEIVSKQAIEGGIVNA